jgi:DNA modification methylase
LGSEPTPELYVAHIVEVFRAVWRVLRSDGTCWINLGDAYASGVAGNSDATFSAKQASNGGSTVRRTRSTLSVGVKPKDLLLMPYRVVLALQANGWYVRSQIAWCKKSAMPESVQDRPSSAWEPLFLLAKSARYFYDNAAVREDSVSDHGSGNGYARPERLSYADNNGARGQANPWLPNGTGRNIRNYWLLGAEPFPAAHFAVFPSEVPRRAILAGTSERGCCPDCAAPWRRLMERTSHSLPVERRNGRAGHAGKPPQQSGWFWTPPELRATGWRPTCKHYDFRYLTEFRQARSVRKRRQRMVSGDWWRRVRRRPAPAAWPTRPATVLDPFVGSGTTVLVVDKLGRHGIGVDLSLDYIDMADDRIVESDRVRREQRDGQLLLLTDGLI